MPNLFPFPSIIGSYYKLEAKLSRNFVCVRSRVRSSSPIWLAFNCLVHITHSSHPFWRPGFQSKFKLSLQRNSTKLWVIKPEVSETVLRFSTKPKPKDTNSMSLSRKLDRRHSNQPSNLINWVKFCVKLSLSHPIPIEFDLPLTRIIHLPSCILRWRYYLITAQLLLLIAWWSGCHQSLCLLTPEIHTYEFNVINLTFQSIN